MHSPSSYAPGSKNRTRADRNSSKSEQNFILRMQKSSIQEIVGSKGARQSLRFEKLLNAADAITDSYFKLKKATKKRRIECAFGSHHSTDLSIGKDGKEEDDDDDLTTPSNATSIAAALVKTLAILTSSEEPGRLETESDAVKWVRNCTLKFKNDIVDKTRRETQAYVFNDVQTLDAVKLISELNTILSQARTKTV